MPSYLSYKRQIAVLDANDIESWITVRGNHIPIKKGQSKEDAVKSFIEGKNEPKGLVEQYAKAHNELNRQENLYMKGKTTEYQVNEARNKALELKGKVQEQSKQESKGINSSKKSESKYDPEFEVVRKNALANGNVYGGKYTQKSKAEAYKEYKNDTSSKENMKKANEFVNGKPEKRELNKEIHDIQKRMKDVGIKRGAKLKFPDGSIQEVELTISDLVDTKKDGKTVTHTFGKLEAGIKNGEIKVINSENKNIPLKTNNPVAKVNTNKWGKEWNKKANKPVTLGEAVKSAAQTSYSLNKKAKQEANYTALEIAYNDVAFTKSPRQNKEDMLKAVSNSGVENIDYMKQTISNMPETAFESHNSFRKGLKDTSKWHSDWFKRANKPVTLGTALKNATNIMKKTKELGKLDKKA